MFAGLALSLSIGVQRFSVCCVCVGSVRSPVSAGSWRGDVKVHAGVHVHGGSWLALMLIPSRQDHLRSSHSIIEVLCSVFLFGWVLADDDTSLVGSGCFWSGRSALPLLAFQMRTTHVNHAPHQPSDLCVSQGWFHFDASRLG